MIEELKLPASNPWRRQGRQTRGGVVQAMQDPCMPGGRAGGRGNAQPTGVLRQAITPNVQNQSKFFYMSRQDWPYYLNFNPALQTL